MNAYEITRQLIKARAAERAMYKALEAVEGVEGTDITGLLTTRRELGERIAELEVQRAEAMEAEEKARRANRRKVTIRRREWDADDKVTVEVVPGKIYGQEVYYKGEHLGLVDGKEAGAWTASPVSGYSRPGLRNRAEAIRVLVANAER